MLFRDYGSAGIYTGVHNLQLPDCLAGTVEHIPQVRPFEWTFIPVPFFLGELVVNLIPRAATLRSSVITEPSPEVETVLLVTHFSHATDPRRRQSSSFDSDGIRVPMTFLGTPSDPLYIFGADPFTAPGFSNPSQARGQEAR